MSLVDWIASNPDAVGVIVATVGGYIWKRAKGQKTEDLWETLQDLATQPLAKLLEDPDVYNKARSTVVQHVWDGLSRLKIKRSPVVEKLVDEVVEWAMARLAEKLMERNLSRFIDVSNQTLATLKAATAS